MTLPSGAIVLPLKPGKDYDLYVTSDGVSYLREWMQVNQRGYSLTLSDGRFHPTDAPSDIYIGTLRNPGTDTVEPSQLQHCLRMDFT